MSRRERQRRRNGRRRPGRPLFLALGIVAATATIGVLALVGWVVGVMASAPSIDSLKPVNPGQSSVVYAADGERLGFIQSDVLRTPITPSQIPDDVRRATVAIEDRRFYNHAGVDVLGIVRAAFRNVTSGHTVEGGSTLTMQLVKKLYDPGRKRTLALKIREAKLAQELEDQHPGRAGKLWILDRYLNEVPYGTVGGQTAVGIQAAARVYFNEPARKLTLAQAALIAGLPQAPSAYNPFLDPARALGRRNEVLQAMVKARYVSAAAADAAAQAPLGVHPSRYYTARREGFFFDYVKDLLIKRYGLDAVRLGGLQIHTTIDLKLQRLARAAMARQLPYASDPASALVSIDPRNGHIVAMASSSKYGDTKFNIAAQGRRQPGSTFKVMTLMTALRRGVDIKSTYYDSHPLDFTDPVSKAHIKVTTDDHHYYGRESLFEALVHSDNTVYQQLDLDMGPKNVRQTAYDMGITSHLDAYPAEGLGGLKYGVTPLEMARAYVTVNTGGYRIDPVAVTKVVFPDRHVDRSLAALHRTKVFTDGQTSEAIKAMEANVQRGTGTAAQIGCPIAGKTGTTSNFTDAWFDGMSTGLNTVVWVGYPKRTTSMTDVPGWGEMFGGSAPAAIFHDFMSVAAPEKGCQSFPPPTTPFNGSEYFGHYAVSGAPGGSSRGYRYGYGSGSQGSYGYGYHRSGTGSYGSGTGAYNNPNLYSAPPQTGPGTGTGSGPGSTGTGSPGSGTGSPGTGTSTGGGAGSPGAGTGNGAHGTGGGTG